jgi:hypothetical protein
MLNKALRIARNIGLNTENGEITLKFNEDSEVTRILVPLNNAQVSYVEDVLKIFHRAKIEASFTADRDLEWKEKE